MELWRPLIVVPMAGRGSRFTLAGFDKPKPLISVVDRPMYAWAVDSLPLQFASELVFVLLQSQPMIDDLCADIEQRYRDFHPRIEYVPSVTRGQAETVLAGLNHRNDTPLLVHNADTSFVVDDSWVRAAYDRGDDGALLVFPSSEDRWSYSRIDTTGAVVEVQEKKVISQWASTGTYWFRSSRRFESMVAAEAAAASKESRELYIGPLYNRLIAEGGRVTNIPVNEMACFGTPHDLAQNLNRVGLLRWRSRG